MNLIPVEILNIKPPDRASVANDRETFVYFMIQLKAGYYEDREFLKVGHSYDPKKRNYQFCDEQSFSKIIGQIRLSSKIKACEVERYIQKKLSGSRKYSDSREYFDLTDEVIFFLKSIGING